MFRRWLGKSRNTASITMGKVAGSGLMDVDAEAEEVPADESVAGGFVVCWACTDATVKVRVMRAATLRELDFMWFEFATRVQFFLELSHNRLSTYPHCGCK